MKKPIKAYAVSNHTSVINWLPATQVYSMEKADVVVFPGGADVNPAVYGESKAHPLTQIDHALDKHQIDEFNLAKSMGKRMVGICRGAQLLCALAGGKLIQHQLRGASYHPVYTYDGKIIEVSSDHHQAMYPWHMKTGDFKVLGWSFGQSVCHVDGDFKEMVIGETPLNMEVEIAFFPDIKALCIQAHPEWQYPSKGTSFSDREAIDYYLSIFEKFMDGENFINAHDSFSVNTVTA